jgi:hypothetical protein
MSALLRTNERNFAADSTADGHGREEYAGNREGETNAKQSERKCVSVMLWIYVLLWKIEDASPVGRRHVSSPTFKAYLIPV